MMMKSLFERNCLDNYKGWTLLILRLAVGLIFLAHGWQKVGIGMNQVGRFFGSVGIPLPLFFAYFVTSLELIGGTLLILGIMTHLVSKIFAIEMLVAFFTVHISNGIFVDKGGFELAMLIFAATAVLMAMGPGEWALDDWFYKNWITRITKR